MSISSLTDREKECLRLLAHPMKAKDIARETQLSVYTVNEHLKSARRKLGTTDSLSAALMLRAHEDPPKNLDTTESGSLPPPDPGQSRFADTSAEKTVLGRIAAVVPLGSRGRPWNDLNLRWRLVWPILLLGVVAFGGGSILAGASELSQLVIALSR
ncbi:helix-turn-helix transcriptional regulator [Sphingomonas sp. CL5.1]|uniref:helix-turn-helix domain-containing protein n=1 Tax=Sphingomonas sp. CL5.1 TaxID=2653203 RepID=UPI0015838E15|nr:helix-turn-helix transcriptional regulator [Sphingomonas sp. CL5.1]QKR99741.1 helix-turn-helix transcriptional regulator [Sphingomonas sp. CL5.1]